MVDNFDVECSRERLREIWWGSVMWNVVGNFDVKCSGERLREIWWITLVWNVVRNGDVGVQRVIL